MYTMKKFIRYYAPYKAVFFLDLICAAVISLVDLAFPQILRTLTKTLFAEPADRILQALLPIGAGLLVIYILQALCKYYAVHVHHSGALQILCQLSGTYDGRQYGTGHAAAAF